MSLEVSDIACLRRGLEHFRAGDYFAAHDDWEEVWQGLRGRRRLFWQAMIQLVVGAYHYTNGNRRGCQRQWHKALSKCDILATDAALPVAAPVQLLGDTLLSLCVALEHDHDPLPMLQSFATSVMSEHWFAFE
jgi:hypothetical protein